MTDFFAQNVEHLVTLALIVFGIVIVGCALEAFRVWTRHREAMATALGARAAQDAAIQAAHSGRLESRVQVLERIATDGGAELSDQIERLRDPRGANQATRELQQ